MTVGSRTVSPNTLDSYLAISNAKNQAGDKKGACVALIPAAKLAHTDSEKFDVDIQWSASGCDQVASDAAAKAKAMVKNLPPGTAPDITEAIEAWENMTVQEKNSNSFVAPENLFGAGINIPTPSTPGAVASIITATLQMRAETCAPGQNNPPINLVDASSSAGIDGGGGDGGTPGAPDAPTGGGSNGFVEPIDTALDY